MRYNNRKHDDLRSCTLEPGFVKYAEGSCLIKLGDTHVIVSATVDEKVPPFLKNSGTGWVTAEYAMLPRAGSQRSNRDGIRGVNGRSVEIQRLIGRSLRSIVDLKKMGERTITIDCDVIRADGGTRTASITAAYVALRQAVNWMLKRRMIKQDIILEPLAAISVGLVGGEEMLDLDYSEDSTADADMNIVMTASGKFVEIQGTAETMPFGVDTLVKLLKFGKKGIDEIVSLQEEALEEKKELAASS